MPEIRIAIAGVGNCASSLLQGLAYYSQHRQGPQASVGLKHPELAGYHLWDIRPVAAFDIDARKVGRPLEEAIFAPPNNTRQITRPLPATGVIVKMGNTLDGVAAHLMDYPPEIRFEPAQLPPVDVAAELRSSGADILLNYLPVGSQKATEFYAQACLDAGTSLINCIPVFIVSDPNWASRFTQRGIPCVGDDIKAQLGATVTHRTLAGLFNDRGVQIDRTYQINTGGNADFLNMLERDRLGGKKISKTQAVQSQLDVPLQNAQIHVGPSDFIPFLKDNKICFLRLEGTGFGGVPLDLELRLSVEDSPNSAGVVVDAIRYCQFARHAKIAGPLELASAWTMKHPPKQIPEHEALKALHVWITRNA
ncbi:MAG: inositol-3-phosphate synthase [Tepidisphaeraceae bacterium]|jgi:myo-inositol-1-phosphate synthase